MHRFYVPDLSRDASAASLPEDDAAHAIRVLRVQAGETVMLLNGRGLRAHARVLEATRRRVSLQIQQTEDRPPPPCGLVLFQSVTKPKSMEWIVQKATELCVHTIQPVITARVVSHWAEADGDKKVEKWQRIAVEALKQCGQPWLPRIEAPARLNSLWENALPPSFLASLQPGIPTLREWLEKHPQPFRPVGPPRVGLWIGPEGDFDPEETRKLLAAGIIPITLGPSVLRSETAAVCGLTLLHYELNLIRTETEPGQETTAQSGPDESAS